ncbi:hypothetical protein [Haloimpatiens massiliensis]|uniref:hypothetical protein n=1 Tax=Haloimpatiens massiliensis TaxID=1658110 RepID=UPI000C81AE8B|nr:hypothetical protein [Haloimpatiens massiliensis]
MGSKVSNSFNRQISQKYRGSQRKYYYYFMWRNKLSDGNIDFSEMTEDEFREKYLQKKDYKTGKIFKGDKSFRHLQMWEGTDEYQTLLKELYSKKMNQDFYDLYEVYLEKAKDGDEKAINALKTIKKEIESLNKSTNVGNLNSQNSTGFDLS